MKRYIHILLFALATAAGCIEEPEFVVENKPNALNDGYITVGFGHQSFDRISVTTRSTVPVAAEDAIVNMYAIMFDSNGDKVYGRYFNLSNRKESRAEMDVSDCWYVDNKDSSKGELTWGEVRMKAPVNLGTGSRLYLFANIDPVILNLSVEKLGLVKTEMELMQMSLKFNQGTTSRTGNLLMIGSADITVGSDSGTITYEPDSYYKPADVSDENYNRISLERIDSKVEVNVAVVPGAKTVKDDGSIQEIESFTPTSWRVMNLPNDTWFLARDAIDTEFAEKGESVPESVLKATKEGGYFNSSTHLFETKTQQSYDEATGYDGYIPNLTNKTTRTVHGFSFYTLENYPEANPNVAGDMTLSLNQRDLRLKDANGEYMVGSDGNIWEYAPKDATYLVIEGEVQMKVNENAAAEGKPQTLNALVTYYVHLGHFDPSNGGHLNNFDIICNSHYIYNININGVNSIEVEVIKDNSEEGWDPSNEAQSGATGEVYLAQEEIHTFDAHYGQWVFHFRFDAILKSLGVKINNGIIEGYDGVMEEIADELTWYVSSPFGREGTPDIVNGNVEVPNGLDYKWVYFLVNDMVDGVYKEENQWFPGSDFKGKVINADIPNNPTAKGKTLMDVSQLCNYLREQIGRRASGREDEFDANREIVVTAFVDEYYYDADPISGEVRDGLWHEFVNKPMRMMHILCSADVSRDGESSATGSVVTIRQRSIQTVYNGETAEFAWGSETVDEIKGDGTRRSLGFYKAGSVTDGSPGYLGNESKENGLFNTALLWGLNSTTFGNKMWGDYLDFEKKNGSVTSINGVDVITDFMKDDESVKTLRYSCMMRNRDEDGDGYIDENEVKWYLASTEQLITLFIGDLGLSGDAQLYNLEAPVKNDYKSHVVSSTAHKKGAWPEIVWAEEGCSIGQYNEWNVDLSNTSVRCVRNLGKDYNALVKEDSPQAPIQMKSDGNGNYRFNMRDLNTASKRIKVTSELVPMDETSEMARVYNGFETGPIGNNGGSLPFDNEWVDPTDDTNARRENARKYSTGSAMSYLTYIKDFLIQGKSYCPEGYRMPNIREAAIMHSYIEDADWWGGRSYAVSNYYSFGHELVGGNGIENGNSNVKNQATWRYNGSSMTLQGDEYRYVRCVRDIEPEEYSWD